MMNNAYEEFEKLILEQIEADKIYSQNESYALQAMLLFFEYRVKRSMKLKTADSRINRELDTLNTSVKQYYKYRNEGNDKSIDHKDVEFFFNKNEKYKIIEDLIILYKSDLYDMEINNNNVVFKNKKISENHSKLNFLNKLKYSQRISNIEVCKEVDNSKDPFEDIFNHSLAYISEVRQMKQNVEFDKFYIDEYYKVYAYFYTYAVMGYISDKLFYISKDRLIIKLKDYFSFTQEKIKMILDLLTYKPGQKIDLICTPLFCVEAVDGEMSYLTSWPLFLFSNIERNSFVLFNNFNKSISNIKEKMMQNRIKIRIGKFKNLDIKFNININRLNSSDIETDIDMSLFDKEKNVLLLCELKNFNRPDSINEHINFQGRKGNEQLNKGFKQLEKIENTLKDRREYVLSKCLKSKVDKCSLKVEYLLISNGYIGYYEPNEFKIVEEDEFLNLIDKYEGDINAVMNKVKDIDTLYNDIECSVDKATFKIGNYSIEYPLMKMKHVDFYLE